MIFDSIVIIDLVAMGTAMLPWCRACRVVWTIWPGFVVRKQTPMGWSREIPKTEDDMCMHVQNAIYIKHTIYLTFRWTTMSFEEARNANSAYVSSSSNLESLRVHLRWANISFDLCYHFSVNRGLNVPTNHTKVISLSCSLSYNKLIYSKPISNQHRFSA